MPEWFREHPEVDTAFVVAITGGKVNVPPGRTMFEAKVNGYRNAWKTLPDTVKHIVVIRDTPKIFADTVECIDRALIAQERVGTTCATPRGRSLEADPQLVAAHTSGSARLHVIDLVERFCSLKRCFPVVGGVLVFKDLHHFTLPWAETLGPPLAEKIAGVAASW